jgi:hypothetical protein
MPPTPTDWFNQTTLHPIGIIALLVLGVATLIVPRRYALVPMLVLACFVAPAQRVVIATLDFNFLRIMILLGWIRIIARGEMVRLTWKPLDTVLVAWAVCAMVTATLLQATGAALINRLGHLYDAIGLYFLCRYLVRDWRDVRMFAQCAAIISIPVALAFIVEKMTARNMFAVFGGVPEITTIRAGRLRCQGPFAHPILAGVFWAALMPLIGALWWYRGWHRPLAIAGLIASFTVVVACASATPLGGVIFGAAVALLLPVRRWMPWIRWTAGASLLLLHLAMVKPIWHLMARVDLVSGSTGWYRYRLIDDFINHFAEWWLIGSASRETWWSGGAYAITNEYILQGVQGGLLTLILFVAILVFAFIGAGRICRHADRPRWRLRRVGTESPTRPTRPRRRIRPHVALGWALGCSIFIHAIVFTGVAYFGQTILVWYLSVAFVASLAPGRHRRRRAAKSTPLGRAVLTPATSPTLRPTPHPVHG